MSIADDTARRQKLRRFRSTHYVYRPHRNRRVMVK